VTAAGKTPSRLTQLIRILRRLHGPPVAPPSRDPYHLLLWEQVAYLAPDEKRLQVFRQLEKEVGLAPTAILEAPRSTLIRLAREGGAIAVAQRAQRLRAVAERVFETWNGNLKRALRLPHEAAGDDPGPAGCFSSASSAWADALPANSSLLFGLPDPLRLSHRPNQHLTATYILTGRH